MKINSDTDRFQQIIKNKLKHNLGKYVSSDRLIAQQGNKKISVPINNISLPRFTFGSNNGGLSQGNGEDGDPIFGDGKKNGNKAGDTTEEHEFASEELASILLEYLELPPLEPKEKGVINTEEDRYTSISRSGSDSLKHFRRSFKEGLKRSIATGSYDPEKPYITPIKDDFRYKSRDVKDAPETKAAMIFIIDVSGSITDEIRQLAKSMSFWLDLLLSNTYKNIQSAFIIHDAGAKEVSREEFFNIKSGGGTKISSAYTMCSDLINKKFNYSEYNNYIFQFSDGGNISNEDNQFCIELLKTIKNNCNLFSYNQIKSPYENGDFIQVLDNVFSCDNKIKLNLMDNDAGIFPAIKTIFSS